MCFLFFLTKHRACAADDRGGGGRTHHSSASCVKLACFRTRGNRVATRETSCVRARLLREWKSRRFVVRHTGTCFFDVFFCLTRKPYEKCNNDRFSSAFLKNVFCYEKSRAYRILRPPSRSVEMRGFFCF